MFDLIYQVLGIFFDLAPVRLAAGTAWRDCGLVVVDEVGDPLAPPVYSDRFRRCVPRR